MSNCQIPISNNSPDNGEKSFNLQERTARFGEAVIALARQVQKDTVNRPLVSQVVRSATSVGANYMEADATLTRKDFRHRLGICLREAKETKHWLRMLAKANAENADTCRQLWQESHELALIFASVVRKLPGPKP